VSVDPATLGGFAALVAVAAFAQTITGFSFGLIAMGGVGLSGMLSLPDAAVVVGLLTLLNAALMLRTGWSAVRRRELALILCGSAPTLGLGYAALEWLADGRVDVLKLALGLLIVAASLQLVLRPEPRAARSGDASFVGMGAASGVMAGLFSTGGPPLIYHLHRQPFPPAAIRETLVAAFGVAAALRLGLVTGAGALPAAALPLLLVGAPAVFAATQAARRWPPPLSPAARRAVVFVLLALSGLSLALPAALHVTGWRQP
jgi:uncharacterized membrane protein YfcA